MLCLFFQKVSTSVLEGITAYCRERDIKEKSESYKFSSVINEAVCVTTIKCGDIKVDVRCAQSVALSNYGN